MKNNRTRFMKTFQLVEEQLLSPLSAFEFCDSDLFQETIQSSEVVSTSSAYCYGEQSFYTTDLSFPPNITKCPSLVDNVTSTTATTTTTTTNDLSLIFDEESTEHGLSSPLDLTNTSVFTNHQYSNCNQDQFDLSLLQNQIPPTTNNNTTFNDPIFSFHHELSNDHDIPIIGPNTLRSVCEDNNLSSMQPLSSNFSFIDPSIDSYLPRLTENSDNFSEHFLLGNDIPTHELEFQGDSAVNFCTDPLPHSFHSSELKALSNEDQQHLINGVGSSTSQLATEMKSLESETLRAPNKLTTEERKQKIHRYMKKRNQRNFSKKIKYACRKTLADSRPRVRGRFARNDEFEENNRSNGNHEEDMDHDMRSFHGVVREEQEKFESSDIFAHFRGLNSFTYNNPMKQLI